MPYFFWYLTLHFTRSVAIRFTSAGMFVKKSSQTGQRLERLIAEDADIELAAFDVLLGDGRRADAFVHERDPLLQLLVGVDDRGLRDADRRLLRQRLDDQREGQALGPANRPADAEDLELRHLDAVIREQLLRERLVAREQQAARIAARVRQLQQLEMADDVLVEDRDVVEALRAG